MLVEVVIEQQQTSQAYSKIKFVWRQLFPPSQILSEKKEKKKKKRALGAKKAILKHWGCGMGSGGVEIAVISFFKFKIFFR